MGLGTIIGIVILLVSIGFVVLMMVSEWSETKETTTMGGSEPIAAPKAARSARSRSGTKAKKKRPARK
jgi:hypothetical protein